MAVVGGGAAGMMAAISAAEGLPRGSVLVLDRGTPLAKVRRTGGGRCNLTNVLLDPRDPARHYPRGADFLRSALSRFGPRETMEWFGERGLPLRQEPGGRVFPVSNLAGDVCDLLLNEASRRGVRILMDWPVASISAAGEGFTVAGPRGSVAARRVILATGGDPRRREPSGYSLARSLGHTLTRLVPSLVALRVAEQWTGELAGVSLPEAGARLLHGGRKVGECAGGLLFAHRSISGPLVFDASSWAAFVSFGPGDPLLMELNLLGGGTIEETTTALAALLDDHPRRGPVAALSALVPKVVAERVLSLAGIDPGRRGGELSRLQRRRLAELLAALPLTVTGREAGGEMVTAGGVPTAEVDQRTMQSKIVPGLHLVGELLDADGLTGGFNLQAAWSTGRLAGEAAARSLGASQK